MENTENVTVALSAGMVAHMREAIAEGDYGSNSDLVQDAMQEWHTRRMLENIGFEEVRRLLREADEHNRTYLSMEEVFGPLEAKYRALSETAEQNSGLK